jgi:hypothetical protein
MTVKALMAHHQLNVTLLAIRTTHPYLRHATADVLQCENPCVAGSRTLGRPFGEGFLSEGSGRSCVVPEMCMCAVLEPPPQVGGWARERSPYLPARRGRGRREGRPFTRLRETNLQKSHASPGRDHPHRLEKARVPPPRKQI